MGRYLRKCKELGERAAMEKTAEISAAGRKRKFYLGESEIFKSSYQHKTIRLAVVTPDNSALPASSWNSSCETEGLDNGLASCCSSNGSSEMTNGASKFPDLEDNEVTVEYVEYITTSAGDSFDCGERLTPSYFYKRETTPLREDQAESGELDSTARPRESSPCPRSTAEKMPSESELQEFFASAEKNLQKKFIDEYNYDMVKDQPLEGRYEWVQVQIKP